MLAALCSLLPAGTCICIPVLRGSRRLGGSCIACRAAVRPGATPLVRIGPGRLRPLYSLTPSAVRAAYVYAAVAAVDCIGGAGVKSAHDCVIWQWPSTHHQLSACSDCCSVQSAGGARMAATRSAVPPMLYACCTFRRSRCGATAAASRATWPRPTAERCIRVRGASTCRCGAPGRAVRAGFALQFNAYAGGRPAGGWCVCMCGCGVMSVAWSDDKQAALISIGTFCDDGHSRHGFEQLQMLRVPAQGVHQFFFCAGVAGAC